MLCWHKCLQPDKIVDNVISADLQPAEPQRPDIPNEGEKESIGKKHYFAKLGHFAPIFNIVSF